jgi:hypothetical protein
MDVVERPPGSRALDADARVPVVRVSGPPMHSYAIEQQVKRMENKPVGLHVPGWFNIEIGDDEPFDAADAGARLYHRCANGYSPLDGRPKRRRTDGLTGAIADKDRV